MGGLEYLLLPLLLLGLLWVMGAPQRRMRKEQAAMMATLAPGAEVMTHGGLYGTVVEIDDDVVVLETAPGVTMRWAKRAIARIVTPVESEESAEELEEYDEEYEGEYDGDEAEYDDEYDEDADDDSDAWEDVEVPDDASSLTESTDESTDDDKPTA